MSGRGEWAEKKAVAFCRARFSYTGMEKGDLTFSRDQVLLACPLSLAAFVHRANAAAAPTNSSGGSRERVGSGSEPTTNMNTNTNTNTSGVRWVLAIHPDGECGRIPANYVTPLAAEEVKQMTEQGTLGQLSSLFGELEQEVAEERKPHATKRRGSEVRKEIRSSKGAAAGTDKRGSGEVESRTTATTPSAEIKSSDSQLQRLIQQKLKTFEDDASGTLKFYHNMRRGVQSLFDPPPSSDE